MKNVQTGYFTDTIIIIVLILTLLTGIASAVTTTYSYLPSTGATVAPGITTNFNCPGTFPTTYSISFLTTAATGGCGATRQYGSNLDPALDMFFNTSYSADTNVTGISYFGRLREGSGAGGGTFTFKLIYLFPNGTIAFLPGTAGSQPIVAGNSSDYTVSLSGMSGIVPAGAKPGLRISLSGASTQLRIYLGDTANTAGTGPSGYFSVNEVLVPGPYTITGLVTDTTGTPISSATVTTNTTLSTTTNATGWYILTGVPNATHLVTASKTDYASNNTMVTVNGANVTAGTIQLDIDYTEVTIDATTSTTNADHRGQPALVFINDTIGYMFYKDSGTASIGYSKTTDGGVTWGARVATTAQTDIAGFNIWYDRWTPADTTGTIIHIAMTDTGNDDVWYDTVDTNGDTQGTEVAMDTTATTLSTADKLTITKNKTGNVFIGFVDANTAGISKVRKCAATCSNVANWANAGTSPLSQADDYIKLVPLASGNVMLIQYSIANISVRSNIFRPDNTWSGWTNISTGIVRSTTYTDTISATVDKSTNDIYFAYGADVAGAGTADIRTATYNGTEWILRTDVITDENTVTNFDMFRDENTGDIYVAYLRGTLLTGMNAYYKKSTDGMVTWSAEKQFNTVTGDLRWMYMNMMSTSRAYAVFLQNTGGSDGLFGNTIAVFPLNILSFSNNVTNDNSLSLTVNQSTIINFNITTDLNIDINITSIPSGVTALSSSSIGGTIYNAIFNFTDYGIQYVKFAVRNITRAGYTTINWTVTVNDITPPNQVTNLTNSTPPTHNQINLKWDGADNPGGSGIMDYFVEKTNNSINWATITPTINASKIRGGNSTTNWTTGKYSDAYYYTFRNTVPVNCSQCHATLGSKQFSIGNLWTKFDSTNIYFFVHANDNDTSNNDDELEFIFDPNKDGGTAPQPDDRKYVLHEDNTTESFVGNGTDWNLTTSSASHAVTGTGGKGPRYEIAIPLSEIGNPTNDSTVKFAFEVECNNGSDFISRINYLPEGASDGNPDSGWLLLTYRNSTVWETVANPTTNSSSIAGLMPNFRYTFSVFARDYAFNIGERSSTYIGQTDDRIGYNLSGYITSGGIPINNATIMTGEYMVYSNANGYYILSDLINGTYNLTVTATDFVSNSSVSIILNGADRNNINITLVDNTIPSVISNINNITFFNNTAITLNATITDIGIGVKNATVDVSAISTTNQAVLTLQGDFWINSSIIADRGATNGLVNLTITAYDYYGNVNNTVNMTVVVLVPPNITSWSNNATGDNSLEFTIVVNDTVFFNVTANQAVAYTWTYDGVDVNYSDTLIQSFSDIAILPSDHYISAIISNINGTAYKNWTITVEPETIDVTLTGVPIDFGNVSSGGFTYPSLPLNVTIQSTTNVNVNLTLSASDFSDGVYSFGVSNLSYSNSSGGSRTNMTATFSLPPYENWINMAKRVNQERPIYFWLSIPVGQDPGTYGSNITVMVEKYD